MHRKIREKYRLKKDFHLKFSPLYITKRNYISKMSHFGIDLIQYVLIVQQLFFCCSFNIPKMQAAVVVLYQVPKSHIYFYENINSEICLAIMVLLSFYRGKVLHHSNSHTKSIVPEVIFRAYFTIFFFYFLGRATSIRSKTHLSLLCQDRVQQISFSFQVVSPPPLFFLKFQTFQNNSFSFF